MMGHLLTLLLSAAMVGQITRASPFYASLAPSISIQSQISDPKECYSALFSVVEASSDDREKIALLTALGEICWGYGRRDEAIRFLDQACEIGHFNEPRLSIADERVAQMARAVTAACATLGLYDRALSIAQNIRDPGEKAWQLMKLAEAMADAGLRDKALSTLAEAYNAIALAKDEYGILSQVARAYAAAGEPEEAERLSAKVNNPYGDFLKLETMSYTAIAMAKARKSEKAEALIDTTLNSALQMKPFGTSDDGKPKLCALLADAYGALGLKDRALELLSRAEGMAKKIKTDLSTEQIVGSYARLGAMSKARSLASTIAYRPSRADSLIEIAQAHLKANERQAAVELLEESFTLSKAIKQEDTFKVDRLVLLAAEFNHSDQRDRANDVLIYALREARQSEDESFDDLVKILKSYAQLKLALNEEACSLIKGITSHEPIPLTPDEESKQKLAEQAANHFIKRWHETLDLNILFDELYVSNTKQRQQNTRMFYGVYKFLSASAGPAVGKDIDDKLMREGFFAFWNMYYLRHEYQLAYQESDSHVLEPPEFKWRSVAQGIKLSSKRMFRRQVLQFIALAKGAPPVYRKYLTAEVFNSPRYLQNVKQNESSSDTHEKRFRVEEGFSEFGVPDEVEVLYLRRGVFEFYFIEENGKLKVLTLGFEL